MRFRNIDYKPVAQPIELRKTKQLDWGVTTQDRMGINIRLTNIERTLVDVLHRPVGGFEEIWRSLETAPYLKLDKVIEYALMLDTANTNARLGFFLEQHKDKFSVKESHLDALRQHKPSLPRKMTNTQESGVLIPAWNLKVPAAVLNGSWKNSNGNQQRTTHRHRQRRPISAKYH